MGTIPRLYKDQCISFRISTMALLRIKRFIVGKTDSRGDSAIFLVRRERNADEEYKSLYMLMLYIIIYLIQCRRKF